MYSPLNLECRPGLRPLFEPVCDSANSFTAETPRSFLSVVYADLIVPLVHSIGNQIGVRPGCAVLAIRMRRNEYFAIGRVPCLFTHTLVLATNESNVTRILVCDVGHYQTAYGTLQDSFRLLWTTGKRNYGRKLGQEVQGQRLEGS